MSLSSRLSLSLAGATLVALLPATPAVAASTSFPDRIPLVDGSRPEGIAGGPGTTYFAGSRLDGTIYTGDLRTGSRTVLVQSPEGLAVGMQYDQATQLLWVAGGTAGTITAYDSRTGRQVLQVTAPGAANARFLNDVDVTRDKVYVTDSRNAELLVVDKASGTLSQLALTGDWVQAAPGVNSANGIRELPSGDLLVVARGGLYRVDPSTGVADLVEVTGRPLAGGDGLELQGSTLYVVSAYADQQTVAVLSLGSQAQTATVTGEIPTGAARPTTMTIAAGRGWVVDGNFTTANSPTSKHDIVQLDL